MRFARRIFTLLLALAAAVPASALANVVQEWNQHALRALSAAQVAGNTRSRALAMTHAAMFEAANAVEGRYSPIVLRLDRAPGASVDAAVASAAHAVLLQLAPSQKTALDAALAATLATVADEKARSAGGAAGAKAGAAIVADRNDDALTAPDDYRPHTTPGVWVPTAAPLFPEYAKAKLWGVSNNAHYRPGPPPKLDSAQWAKDYNETKALGGRTSKERTAAQTEAVRFWSQPALAGSPDQIGRQLVDAKKLGPLEAARLYAQLYVAVANTFMADWDAKFTYNFWRPVTAIRNGDRDGHDATERDATWAPLNATPMHPEYPSQAAIIAAVLRTVVERNFGAANGPFTIADPADPAKPRRTFANVAAIAQEMNDVRIWGGVHFRASLEAADGMGRRIAEDVLAGMMKPL